MFENIVLTGFADEIAASLDTQMQVLEKLHMNYIEMRGVDGRNFVEYSAAEAKEIRKRLEDRGFALSAVGSPLGKIGITDDFAPPYGTVQAYRGVGAYYGNPQYSDV